MWRCSSSCPSTICWKSLASHTDEQLLWKSSLRKDSPGRTLTRTFPRQVGLLLAVCLAYFSSNAFAFLKFLSSLLSLSQTRFLLDIPMLRLCTDKRHRRSSQNSCDVDLQSVLESCQCFGWVEGQAWGSSVASLCFKRPVLEDFADLPQYL